MNTRSLFADAAGAAAAARYALPVPAGERRALAAGWLWLALAALVGSGLFSILLVLSRAPYVKELFPLADFFRVALVVHVDLSVLVWFAAFGGILWTLNGSTRLLAWSWAALALCAVGTLVLCAAPFLEAAPPVMSNYVPVLDGPVFLRGLLVFAAGCALLVLRSMLAAPRVGTRPDGASALRFGLNAALVSAAVALIAFAWSWSALPSTLDGKAYYEVLFWGGGHVLQFTWTLLMFAAWLWLADAIGARAPLSPRIAILLFAIGLASVFATPVLYLAYDVVSLEHYRMQTWLMRIGGGLAIVPFLLAVALAAASAPRAAPSTRPLRAALAWSLALFAAGGLIGLAIHGSNVKIPAHYHGSIVGVTLAFMGLAFHLLPRLGYAAPEPRLATLQPWLYGGGQLLHVLGLLWSGGYGVQRKVAGADQVLRGFEQVAAMGLMGLGGLLAVAGGILFVVVVLRAMATRTWTSFTSPS
ncbi:MAG: cbb3-type cytochrome c oxidase subunit I [Betaproteobacteria bacterium]|nr:cbb3-type cytochrome c oxidase subunit I [Betaproteobacteria bacterium]